VNVVKPLLLKDWFSDDVRGLIGVNPVSVSPKPVHALSNYLHALLEISQQPKRLPDVARLVATKQGLWAISNESIRDQVKIDLPSDNYALDRLRHALAGLLAADRAVFKSPYSFQVAHLGLVAGDRTDTDLGQLSASLLLMGKDGHEVITGLVARLLERQPNPHWALAEALSPVSPDNVQVTEEMAPPKWAEDPACEQLASELHKLLVRSTRLVEGAHDSLMSLRVLATTITWIGTIVFAQVPTLLLERRLRPLLCETGSPGQLPDLRDASASSRRALNGAWEAWLGQRLTETLKERFGETEPTSDEMLAYLAECEPYTLSGGSKDAKGKIADVFRSWSVDSNHFEAGGRALQDMLAASMGNKPQKWFDAVGRHCGFIGPRRGHPSRFRVEVSLVPTLILAGLADGDGDTVPMSEWLDRLATRFGVLVGPHHQSRAMSDRAPEEDLERNRDFLSHLLASTGLARRFSDGVTEILNLEQLWRRKK